MDTLVLISSGVTWLLLTLIIIALGIGIYFLKRIKDKQEEMEEGITIIKEILTIIGAGFQALVHIRNALFAVFVAAKKFLKR